MLKTDEMGNELGALLRAAREGKGLTQGQVGEHIGVTYSAIGQYESGTIKKPKPEKIAALVDFLDLDRELVDRVVREQYGLVLNRDDGPSANSKLSAPRRPASNVQFEPNAPSLRSLAGRGRTVPELGIAVAGSAGDFSMNGEIVGRAPMPAALAGRDIFAVRVKSDSMRPRFKEGELVYVENRREPVVGEDGIIELHAEEEGGAGSAFIKELVSKSSREIVAVQHNPKETLRFPRERVKALYRVIPWNEVLGT